jgi:hypothetical protein
MQTFTINYWRFCTYANNTIDIRAYHFFIGGEGEGGDFFGYNTPPFIKGLLNLI